MAERDSTTSTTAVGRAAGLSASPDGDRLAVVRTADATLPPGTDLAVRARGVHKSYRVSAGEVRRAVDDLDLDVARGEIVALLGPNGAGKSTATEILEGYRHRDGGDVEVLGHDPSRAPLSWRARIGIVLQETSEPLDLTVTELLTHWATLYPGARPVEEVIALVGLTDKRRSRMVALSGGQRRRLDVALGIIGRPELLFLDEPTTGFDPAARRQFWGLIEDLRDEGTTILLTTHYLDEAARLADRVAVIAAGRLVACDPPDTLGGQLRRAALVRWRDPQGHSHEETTVSPTALVQRLASAVQGEVPDLQVQRMSLEDVYLQLVGAVEGGTAVPGEQEQVR